MQLLKYIQLLHHSTEDMWQDIPYEADGIYYLQQYVNHHVLMPVICNISVQSDNNTVFKPRTHLKSLSGNKFPKFYTLSTFHKAQI
jgi:hypothetical protein